MALEQQKNGLVTEPFRARRRTGDEPRNVTLRRPNDFAVLGDRQRAIEHGIAAGVGHRFHLTKNSLDSCGWIFAVPRGVYAGPAFERRYRKAGVIRKRPVVNEFTVVLCLQDGVGEKGNTGLFDGSDTWRKRIEEPIRDFAESRANLDDFSRIRCRDDEASHVLNRDLSSTFQNFLLDLDQLTDTASAKVQELL